MSFFRKMWERRSDLRSLPYSIFFNFKYLPFVQAYRLPILLYKPKLLCMKGKVKLEVPKVMPGMIRLGFPIVSVYPNSGFMWENLGGTVVFKGTCTIGNNAFMSVGKKGEVIFGDDFLASSSVKIISYRKIEFGIKARVGWECVIMDSNFHPLLDMKTGKYKKASGPISIGDYNWLGTRCNVMHSVITPERCIFGLSSVITRGGTYESYCIHGGNPVKVISRQIMRDYEHDIEVIH